MIIYTMNEPHEQTQLFIEKKQRKTTIIIMIIIIPIYYYHHTYNYYNASIYVYVYI
jgi:hypothetical protein